MENMLIRQLQTGTLHIDLNAHENEILNDIIGLRLVRNLFQQLYN